jgi:phosphatidylglycerophosphatase A
MKNSLSDRLALTIATWFGCGYWPWGPGTAGALAALLIAMAMHYWWGAGRLAIAVLTLLLVVPGIWASSRTAVLMNKKDPGMVVVDEVLGLWITLLGASVFNWKTWLLGFALFRIFDILKPPPVRQLERLPGGAGIVCDDLFAGVYGALVLILAGWCNLY